MRLTSRFYSVALCCQVLLVLDLSQIWLIECQSESIFATKNYALRSTIYFIDNKVSTKFVVDEAYSNQQQRAKFQLQNFAPKTSKDDIWKHGPGDWFTYLVDEKLMLHQAYPMNRCEVSTLDEFLASFRFNFILDIDESERVDKLIIGPSRLAAIIQNNRNKLQLSEINAAVVRNIPSVRYKIDLTYQKTKTVHLQVFYDEFSASDENALPFMITGAVTSDHVFAIEYTKLESLGQNAFRAASKMQIYKDKVLYDRFANFGCTAALKSVRQMKPLLEDSISENMRLSFAAKVTEKKLFQKSPTIERTIYVNFDGLLNVMRMDTLDPMSHSMLQMQRQLFDFDNKRAYHIVSKSITEVKKKSDADDYRCVTSALMDQFKHFESISQLIFGASKFVYLGRGQVRGIRSFIYEADETSLPFWLDPSVAYNRSFDVNETKLDLRVPGIQASGFGAIFFSTTVFISEQLHVPLMIVIRGYYLDALRFKKDFVRRQIMLHNFEWDISSEAPNGDESDDMFKLPDSCVDESSLSSDIRVGLLLKSSENIYSQIAIQTSNSRALRMSILAGVQKDLEIPVTHLRDLSTHFIQSQVENKHDQKALVISSSFRVADPTNQLIELYQVGSGLTENELFFAATFHDCYMAAAHLKRNLYFSYEPSANQCSLGTAEIEFDVNGKPTSSLKSNGFVVVEKATKFMREIYSLRHTVDWTGVNEHSNRWIDRSKGTHKDMVHWRDKDFQLRGFSSSIDSKLLVLQIKRVHFHEQSSNRFDPTKGVAGSGEPTDIDEIVGFGMLVDEDGSNPHVTRIKPVQLESPTMEASAFSGPALTSEQCEAACLTDLNCLWYSICIKASGIECVKTNLTLSSPEILKQLSSLPNRIGSVNELSLPEEQQQPSEKSTLVKVKRHPNCSIHRKNFHKMFLLPSKFKLFSGALQSFTITPTDSSHTCAQRCAMSTIESVMVHRSSSRKQMQDLSSGASGSNPFKANSLSVCVSFAYLSEANMINSLSEDEQKILRAKLAAQMLDFNDTQASGYCFETQNYNSQARDQLAGTGKKVDIDSNVWFEADTYSIRPEIFYERSERGIRLKRSTRTLEEKKAYTSIVLGDGSVGREQMDLMRSFVMRHENSQMPIRNMELGACAMHCLMQNVKIWPSCRSFDISIVREHSAHTTICTLNSITLAQAIEANRTDLIERVPADEAEVYHYEPRLGFARELAELESEFELGLVWMSENLAKRSHGLILTALMLCSVILGVFIGFKVGSWHRERMSNKRRESASSFIDLVPRAL